MNRRGFFRTLGAGCIATLLGKDLFTCEGRVVPKVEQKHIEAHGTSLTFTSNTSDFLYFDGVEITPPPINIGTLRPCMVTMIYDPGVFDDNLYYNFVCRGV